MGTQGKITIIRIRGFDLRRFGSRFARGFVGDGCTDGAAQLAFYFFFALFPLLFFLVTLAAYLPLRPAVGDLMVRIRDFMPPEASKIIERQVSSLLWHRPRLLTTGLLVAIWSASRGVNVLRNALNRAYKVEESRSWLRTQLLAVFMTATISLMVLASFGMILTGGRAGFWVASHLHLGRQFMMFWSWLRWPTTALTIMLAIALAYYFLPNVAQRFRFFTAGTVTATALWLASTLGFTEYVAHFGRYNVTYGSIGGVIVLLLWLYVTGLVLIIGGEVNAALTRAVRQNDPLSMREMISSWRSRLKSQK